MVISGLVEVLQLYFQKCFATYFDFKVTKSTKLSLVAENMLNCVCVDFDVYFGIAFSNLHVDYHFQNLFSKRKKIV